MLVFLLAYAKALGGDIQESMSYQYFLNVVIKSSIRASDQSVDNVSFVDCWD